MNTLDVLRRTVKSAALRFAQEAERKLWLFVRRQERRRS